MATQKMASALWGRSQTRQHGETPQRHQRAPNHAPFYLTLSAALMLGCTWARARKTRMKVMMEDLRGREGDEAVEHWDFCANLAR